MLHALAACGTLGVFVGVVYTQTIVDAQTATSAKQTLEFIVLTGAVLTILGNVAWSFFNRRSYDKLKEVIAEQKELIDSHTQRHANLKLVCAEAETRLGCRIATLEAENQRLRVSNQGVVSLNLQMRAILRELRLKGLWEGHEDQLVHDTEG